MSELSLQLKDDRLTTAEILYYLPDQPHVLQSYLWQEDDLPPLFPKLRKFLDFWAHNLDGRLHSVKVGSVSIMEPPRIKTVEDLIALH